MDLKDKLDLLWKYLLLAAVIVFGILLVTRYPGYCGSDRHFNPRGYMHPMSMSHMGMMDPGKIKVEKKVIDGDTTVMVWLDGKLVDDPEEFLKKHRKDYTAKMHDMRMMHENCPRMDDDDDEDDD